MVICSHTCTSGTAMLSVTGAPFCEDASALDDGCQELLGALELLPTDRPVRFAFSLSARCCTSCWKDLQPGERVTPWQPCCTDATCLTSPRQQGHLIWYSRSALSFVTSLSRSPRAAPSRSFTVSASARPAWPQM